MNYTCWIQENRCLHIGNDNIIVQEKKDGKWQTGYRYCSEKCHKNKHKRYSNQKCECKYGFFYEVNKNSLHNL